MTSTKAAWSHPARVTRGWTRGPGGRSQAKRNRLGSSLIEGIRCGAALALPLQRSPFAPTTLSNVPYNGLYFPYNSLHFSLQWSPFPPHWSIFPLQWSIHPLQRPPFSPTIIPIFPYNGLHFPTSRNKLIKVVRGIFLLCPTRFGHFLRRSLQLGVLGGQNSPLSRDVTQVTSDTRLTCRRRRYLSSVPPSPLLHPLPPPRG